MFGLAVIVVLISLSIFFVVKFKAAQKPQMYQKEYIVDQGASNFMISVMNVGVQECGGIYDVQALAKDCASQKKIRCSGLDSCYLANKTISTILNRTFAEWNYKFRFYSQDLGWDEGSHFYVNGAVYSGEIYMNNLNCSDSDEKGQSGVVDVPLYPVPGNIRMILELCSQ